jgi:hypothetical protein
MPSGPVIVSMGRVPALRAENAMDVKPRAIPRDTNTIVDTHKPKLNFPLSTTSSDTEKCQKI